MMFDSHIHLQDERIFPDIDRLLGDAVISGITGWLCCGSAQSDWQCVKEIAIKYHGIIPAYGVHPWYVKEATSDWAQVLGRFLDFGSAAIGEIGLDHAITSRDDGLQEMFFRAQFEMAVERGIPVSVHCRKAWDEMVCILKEFRMKKTKVILHSYSGPAELVPTLVDLNCWFSFSGSITRSNNKRGHKAFLAVPEERLLVETDAPDLAPVIDHGVAEPNVPANLVYVLDKMAELRGVTKEIIAQMTWDNAREVLREIDGDVK